MTTLRDEKRARFKGTTRPKGGAGKGWWVLACAAVLAAGAAGYWFYLRPEEPAPGNDPVARNAAAGDYVEMTDISVPAATGGRISIPLAAIEEKKLVRFAYGEKNTPVLAYIAPSGKVVTAISMCEPCRSDRFHIEGEELVCNACGTRWTLEDLRGISGGCPEYPPERLKNQSSGDAVTIGEKDVTGWVPRV
ncbi:MAG: Fe-S-containing protein [Patescibacteria group bacterium]